MSAKGIVSKITCGSGRKKKTENEGGGWPGQEAGGQVGESPSSTESGAGGKSLPIGGKK